MSDHPNVYWTADRSTLVEEGDVRAAFLAYAGVDPIPPEHLVLLAEQRSDDPPEPAPIASPAPKSAAKRAPKPRTAKG